MFDLYRVSIFHPCKMKRVRNGVITGRDYIEYVSRAI